MSQLTHARNRKSLYGEVHKRWPFSNAFGDDIEREWIYQLEDKLVMWHGEKVIRHADFLAVVRDFDDHN